MNKDSFDFERELEWLEKELKVDSGDIEPAPLRAEFRDELRSRLADNFDRKNASSRERKAPRIKVFFSGIFDKIPKGLIPSPKLPRFGAVFTRTRKLKLVASLALVVFMFTMVFYGLDRLGLFLEKPVMAAEVSIQALQEDKLGIDLQAGFLLTSQESLDEKTVRDTLRILPAISYDLQKSNGGKEYRIIPKEKLAVDTVYTLTFDMTGQERDACSWAFQTKGSFRIIRSLPMTNSTHVPADTGIEITFSHENFDASKAQEHVTISPRVEGSFQQHKKTLVFVPKKLEPATIYTVTVSKGFPLQGSTQGLEEDYSFSFETSPDQSKEAEFSFEMDTGLQEFAVAEAPVLPAFFNAHYYLQQKTGEAVTIPQLEIKIFKYPDHVGFIQALAERDKIPEWSYQARRDYRVDLGNLNQVAEYKTDFISVDSYNHYAVFKDALPAGYYAVELKAGECIRQVWFQVSDLATYLALGEEKGLIWANDLVTKKPVSGIEVEVVGSAVSSRGDESGVAVLDYGFKAKDSESVGSYAWVNKGEQEAVVPLKGYAPGIFQDSIDKRNYWKYLYLEREMFKPGDELNFWGILAPRVKGEPQIKEVEVEILSSSGPLHEGGENSPILSMRVPVTNKTYEGRLKLPVLKPDYYYLQVKNGETILLSRGFSIETYDKPAYRLDLSAEKEAIFIGEGMNFEAKASFFEGTPVPGLQLNYHIYDKNGTVTTGDRGTARIPYIGQMQGEGHTPSYYRQYLGVSTNLPEAGEITAADSILVFRSKVYLKGDISRNDEEIIVGADLSNVDLSKINAGEYPSEENFLAGPAGNTLIKGSIYQDIWTKVESGDRYDFINKKVVKDYYYQHSTRHVSDFSMITDKEGEASYTGNLDTKNSYYIVLSSEDSEGRPIEIRLTVPGAGRPQPYDYKYYYLAEPEEGKQYLPGDEVDLTFMENDSVLVPREKAFLYFRGQKQIDSYEVSGNAKYGFVFKEEQIPNINVWGVYFDGNAYQETGSKMVTFARESRSLKVQIETDKEEYRPGEAVNLKLNVTDSDNNPVRAQVNLNLVDEAIYSMQDQHVNLLNSLYTDYIQMYISTRKSHYHPGYHGGAEKGGEGESFRKDFRDTVLFVTVETDGEGKAQTAFKLPDNLTSWRVTYHALTDGVEAGSGTTQIPVKLPFFVEVLTSGTYLKGDAPAVILRPYGDKLEFQSPVNFKMKLVTPQGEEISSSGQGSAFTAFDWKLPPLEEGKYSLLVEASSGEYEDKIIKEFTVSESFLERTITKHALLDEKIQLAGLSDLKEPLTLVFSDYEKSQYLSGIYELAWQGGSRFEQQLAAREARQLLSKYFPDEKAYMAEEKTNVLLQYQQYDGGIAILPYAESELYLTALAASCSGKDLDNRAMAGYFYRMLEQDEKEVDWSAALWGLSALKEPVLLQVNRMLEQEDLAPAEKINLALALLDIGNGAVGEKVFAQLLKDYGEDLGSAMRINVGRDQDEIIEATTQMALLAARLDHPQKNKLYQYLLENRGTDILNLVEKLLILKYNLQYMNPEPVSFTYELNGEKATKNLKGQETFKLTVLPGDVGTLKFSNVKGKIGVVTSYTTTFRADEIKPQEGLSVKRSYLVGKKEVSVLERSDLVEVAITYSIGDKAPSGSYEIVDVLPAGLRYVSRPYIREKPDKYLAYPTEVKGQKLTFAAGKGDEKLVYYARVVSPGDYVAEPVLLSNIRSNMISVLSSEDRIVIK